MNLEEAWTELGRDAARVLATMANLPREERVAAAEKILVKARRMAAKASAPHHPDKGGDPEKFRRVWGAVDVIEKWTIWYRDKMAEIDRKAAERRETGTFIEINKK